MPLLRKRRLARRPAGRFLTDEEYAHFKARYHPRHIRRTRDQQPERLENVVAGLLASAQNSRESIGLFQAARVIRAYRGDGLSWTAERLAEIVAERAPTSRLLPFYGWRAPYQLPEIVRHVGLRRSLRLFARAGLYDTRFWKRLPIDIGVIAIAAVLMMAGQVLSPGASQTVAVYATLCGLLAAILANHVRIGRGTEALSELVRRLERSAGGPPGSESSSPQVQRAIDALAVAFHGLPRPACVIVDDFSRIDYFTQAVLHKAMRAGRTAGQGRVLWIVLEQVEAAELSREFTTRPSAKAEYAGGAIEIVTLEPLSVEENETVLGANGLALDRARDGLFVQALVKGANAAETEQLVAILDALAQTEGERTGLHPSTLFRIIAANSRQVGFDLSTSEYERIFLERPGEGKRRLFPALLSTYVDTPYLSRDRATEMLRGLQQGLERFLMPVKSPTDPLRVRAVADDVLRRWTRSQLPADVIEWFWFMWWYRARRPTFGSTAVLQKLSSHARNARVDERLLSSADGPALAEETIHALMQVCDACFHATLFADALQTARSLLANVRAVLDVGLGGEAVISDQAWSSLTRICWQVYLASGDETFLLKLLALLGDARPPGTADARDTSFDVVGPYLRVMNTPESEFAAMSRALHRLLMRDAKLGIRLRSHMQCRTLDALMLCEQCSSTEMVQRAGLPSALQVAASIDTKELVAICDRIYDTAESNFTILDHFVLRDALRHAVRVRDVGTALEIVPAFVLAPGTTQKRSLPNTRTLTLLERAFRLQALAACLDALLRLAVSTGPARKPQYQFQSSPSEFRFRTDIVVSGRLARDVADVSEVAREILGGTRDRFREDEPVPPTALARVGDLYVCAALAWEELGLEQLRNRTLMDRALFLLEFTDADPVSPDTFRPIIQNLGPALAGPGVQPVLYHLELAAFFWPVVHMRSVYVTEAVSRLLRLGVGSDMALLFCTFLNHLPMAGTFETIAAVRHVVTLLSDEEFREHFVERFGNDMETAALINHVMSIATRSAVDLKPGADELTAALIAHPALAADVRTELEAVRDLYWLTSASPPASIVEVEATLREWAARQDHWLFPRVLSHLLRWCPDAPGLLEQSLCLLEQGDRAFRGSPGMHLALHVARLAAAGGDRALQGRVLAILKKEAVPRAGQWEIESAVDTFQLLMALDSKNERDYLAHHAHWTGLMLERDRAQAFAVMLNEGHYFGVFQGYWDALQVYALPHIFVEESWCKSLRLLIDAEPARAVDACLRRMQENPPPLIVRPQGVPAIVIDFVIVGQVLFGSDVSPQEAGFARNVLNEATGKDLRSFLDIVLSSEAVPGVLRDIIRDHRSDISDVLARQRRAA